MVQGSVLRRVGGAFDPSFNYLTDVGAYSSSDSPYGTFDQGGNAWEWNETASGSEVGLRGGSWGNFASALAASAPLISTGPFHESIGVGFRVASLVPEPGTGLLVMTGLLGLAARRKQRA